jgi:hypothetical protein
MCKYSPQIMHVHVTLKYWPIHSAMSADELCRLISCHTTVEPRLCDVYPGLQTPSWHPQQTGATRWWPPAPLPRVAFRHSNGLCFLWVFNNATNTPSEVHGHTGPHTFLHYTQLLMWVHCWFVYMIHFILSTCGLWSSGLWCCVSYGWLSAFHFHHLQEGLHSITTAVNYIEYM